MGKTGFCDLLKEHGIDPARFIAQQSEMIGLWLEKAEAAKESGNFRQYVEMDQTVTDTQKLINIIERERVQEKINEVTDNHSLTGEKTTT